MSDSNRRDRYSSIVVIAALAAIVLISWFSQPIQKDISDPYINTSECQQPGCGPEEGHWWPEIAARDTYAQWLMAVLAGVAALFGIRAVIWTREAVHTNKAQVRAYVQLDDIKATFSTEGKSTVIRAFVKWKNTGQSPTQKLIWVIDHRIGPVADDFDFSLSSDATRGTAAIGSGQTTCDVSHSIDRDRHAVNKTGITLFGFVEYNDVFPGTPRHRTEFCVEIIRGKGINIENYTSTRHNGADADCLKRPTT